jgi:hypothetical protein
MDAWKMTSSLRERPQIQRKLYAAGSPIKLQYFDLVSAKQGE